MDEQLKLIFAECNKARQAVIKAENEMEEILVKLDTTEIHQTYLKKSNALSDLRKVKTESEKKLRETGVVLWNTEGYDQTDKKMLGGNITVSKDVKWDENTVMAWAREVCQILILESLDEKTLKNLAKTKDIPSFVTTDVIKFSVASDFTKFLKE
ncbi:MAG: hypothetical protein ACTSQA_01145 [Candidatus Heimdallarchaeaceae archaeon]